MVGLVGAANQLMVDQISGFRARSEPALIRTALADLFDVTYERFIARPSGGG